MRTKSKAHTPKKAQKRAARAANAPHATMKEGISPNTTPINLFHIHKDQLFRWLLRAAGEEAQVFVPTKRDVTRFETLTKKNAEDVEKHFSLAENSLFPIKEHFFAKQEVLFDFKDGAIKEAHAPVVPKVFFGLRRCDLAAITHQDKAFLEGGFVDPYYKARREKTIVIGYHCPTAPSPYCFCGSLDLDVRFDLMFYGPGEDGGYCVEVGSARGTDLMRKSKDLFKPTPRCSASVSKKIPGSDRLHELNLKPLYDNPDWKKGVDLCLSCGACTTLCPTCYCFEHKDQVSMANPKQGQRVREWSSCQLPDFTKVAGGHTFRQKREERFKHRIYHQLDYFKERMGVNLCVGCGRCIEGCPTRIDFVDIINKMKKGPQGGP